MKVGQESLSVGTNFFLQSEFEGVTVCPYNMALFCCFWLSDLSSQYCDMHGLVTYL